MILVAISGIANSVYSEEYKDLTTYFRSCSNDTIAEAERVLDSLEEPLDTDGKTCLMYACLYGCAAIASDLLAKGVDPDKQDRWGTTALMYCFIGPRAIFSENFIKKVNASKQDQQGANALMQLIENRNFRSSDKVHIVKKLITAGTKLEARENNQGCTALGLAAQYSSVAVMNTLLESGASLMNREDLCPPAYMAIDHGCDNCLTLLIRHKVLESSSEAFKWSCFTRALGESRCKQAEILVAAEAPTLYSKEANGQTAVFMALNAGCTKAMKQLLNYVKRHHTELLQQQLTRLPENLDYHGSLLDCATHWQNEAAVNFLKKFIVETNGKLVGDSSKSVLFRLKSTGIVLISIGSLIMIYGLFFVQN